MGVGDDGGFGKGLEKIVNGLASLDDNNIHFYKVFTVYYYHQSCSSIMEKLYNLQYYGMKIACLLLDLFRMISSSFFICNLLNASNDTVLNEQEEQHGGGYLAMVLCLRHKM